MNTSTKLNPIIDAVEQAKKLLVFYRNPEADDFKWSVDEEAKFIGHIESTPSFSVYEVMGYVYKGKYRMRFSYYDSDGYYVLMGMEIMEDAAL